MRLIERSDRMFQRTENPEIAASLVSEALRHGGRTKLGIDQLRTSSAHSSDSDIVAAVRRGELLLVIDQFSSFGSSFVGDPAPRPTPEPIYSPPKEQWPPPSPVTIWCLPNPAFRVNGAKRTLGRPPSPLRTSGT